jgi:hypothetical protein
MMLKILNYIGLVLIGAISLVVFTTFIQPRDGDLREQAKPIQPFYQQIGDNLMGQTAAPPKVKEANVVQVKVTNVSQVTLSIKAPPTAVGSRLVPGGSTTVNVGKQGVSVVVPDNAS